MTQDKLNEALSMVMSSVDIRLRDKLSVLLPALDLLEKRVASGCETDAAVLRYLGEARRAAFSILRLANNLGDQAKYAVDYDMSDPERTDLTALFADIIAETHKMAAYKGVSVAFECFETPFYAYVDPGMISRLLYNLLSNAVLHGEGDVGVDLTREDGFILFNIRSAGGEMSGLYEGSLPGTGLSVASAIVLQSSGTMMVSSDKANGTVVTVSLPDLPGGDEGELSILVDPCAFPRHLVELSDFPAYHSDYNLRRRAEQTDAKHTMGAGRKNSLYPADSGHGEA